MPLPVCRLATIVFSLTWQTLSHNDNHREILSGHSICTSQFLYMKVWYYIIILCPVDIRNGAYIHLSVDNSTHHLSTLQMLLPTHPPFLVVEVDQFTWMTWHALELKKP